MAEICKRCGCEFVRRQGKNLFCVPCARERRLQTKREYAARKNGRPSYKPIGSEIKCAGCGVSVVFCGGKHKFCEPCAIKSQKLRFKRFRTTAHGSSLYRRLDAIRRKTEHRRAQMRAYLRPYGKRRRSIPRHAINSRMSGMVRRGLRDGKQGKSWTTLLGFTLDALMRHLERQFVPGMSWENFRNWHIDHITPLSNFKFDSATDEEFQRAWALTNLRPLWGHENLSKGNKRVFLL